MRFIFEPTRLFQESVDFLDICLDFLSEELLNVLLLEARPRCGIRIAESFVSYFLVLILILSLYSSTINDAAPRGQSFFINAFSCYHL